MALLHFEGFDAFANGSGGGPSIIADVANSGVYMGWTAATGGIKAAGELGGSAWFSNGGSNNLIQYSFSPLTTFIVGFRYNAVVDGTNKFIAQIFDSAGAEQIGIGVNGFFLTVWRGATTTIIGTGTTRIVNGSWYYLELKATINSSTGSFTLRLNGLNEITATNVNTQATGNANVATIRWQNTGSGTMGVDDFYLSDTTGGAPLNTFLCDPVNALRVETLFCTANNSVTWTPNASTNVSQIQEVNSDNDVTFNSTASPAIDLFTHGPLVSTPVTIYAINVMAKMRSDDVSNMTGRGKLVSGATTSNGTTNLQATVYQYQKDQYVNDPNTGLAWANAAAVNNTVIGYERVT